MDTDLKALCCLICQVALPPDHVSSHIELKHPAIKLDSARYCQAVADVGVPMALPTTITGGRSHRPYKGLLIQDGIACHSCSYACRSKSNMGDHHRAQHPSIPTPKTWTPCKIQQLDRGAHKTFWRVADTKETSCDHQEVIDRMRNEMAEVIRVEQIPQDKRMASPWLLTTKWHEHVAGHDVTTLRGLVGIPKADDPTMANLADAVEQYFESALVLLDTTDELILQRLNSPDPSKE